MSLVSLAPAGWQVGFLHVMPAVQRHVALRFRHARPERRAEAVQEAIAAACVSFRRLAIQGRLSAAHPSTLAAYAVNHVRGGRHVGGRQDAARDALSPAAQARHGFTARCLSADAERPAGILSQVVAADRRTPIPDHVAFRLDLRQWLSTLGPRDRRVIAALVQGDGTFDVAARFGLSAGRVSQMRRRYEQSWGAFQGEAARAAV